MLGSTPTLTVVLPLPPGALVIAAQVTGLEAVHGQARSLATSARLAKPPSEATEMVVGDTS